MYLPIQTKPITRNVSTARATQIAVTPSYYVSDNPISLAGCSTFKKIACASAVAACTAACVSGVGSATCINCFVAIGSAGCIDCV